jgi:exopolysaccharide/PEP-CTERM locus tyrosine autokinase
MVQFDDKALRDVGLLAPESDASALAAEYRNIKRPLVAHAFGKRATKIPDGHLVMVTSAMPGEGKTFTCINLSLSLAQERDVSVLLVDADLAKPHITSLFGLQDEPGLLDVLDGSVDGLNSVILDTSIPGLKLLPAGRPRDNATELLASQRMEQVVRELGQGQDHRLVLFDSPPLLLTSEARVLASLVGQIAVVVKAEFTPHRAVLEAIATLPDEKAANLILNQAKAGSTGSYYGSGKHYGYGGEYGEQFRQEADQV